MTEIDNKLLTYKDNIAHFISNDKETFQELAKEIKELIKKKL